MSGELETVGDYSSSLGNELNIASQNQASAAKQAADLAAANALYNTPGALGPDDGFIGLNNPVGNTSNNYVQPGSYTMDANGVKTAVTDLSGITKWLADNKGLVTAGGALLGLTGANANQTTPTGYQGGIPSLTATRSMITAPPVGTGYRPGQGGINYGGDVTYTRTPGVDPWANLSGTSGVDLSGINNVYNNSYAAAQAAAAKAAADLAAAQKAGNAAAIAAAQKAAADAAAAAKAAADKAANDRAAAAAAKAAADAAAKAAADKAAADAAAKAAGSTGYQAAIKAGLTPMQYLNNINQWILDNPRASKDQVAAAMKQFGVSDTDLQTALGQSNFSDATKYALTHGMGLQEMNMNIANWVAEHPYATNADIQAIQKKYGVSDEDVARGLNALTTSAGKEYAIVHDMGLDQLYKNILDYQAAGHTPAEIAAAMAATGVEQRDINAAARYAADTGYQANAASQAGIQQFLPPTKQNEVQNLTPPPVIPPPVQQPSGLDTKNEIYQYFASPATQAALASGDIRSIADTMDALGYSPAEVAAATGTPLADVEAAYNSVRDDSYMQYASGGEINMAKGRYLQGETDGMADKLPAQIGSNQPAALSHGEFVIPADVVSHMGNGNSDAGAKKLYQMMDKIRMARTGTKKQGKKINPDKFMPGGLAQAYAKGGKVKKFQEGGETTEQWAARQPDLSNVANAMERKNALESWQKQRPGYVDPTDFTNYDAYAGAAGIQSGKDAGNDLQNRANFYGMTIENYQNALSGDQTKPMGQYQQVYGNQLLSPIEQVAAQTARAQGLGEPNAYAMMLAKKNPEIFNAASQKFHDFMTKTYPETLEYESVLKGPSVYDRTGMKKAATGGLMKLAEGGSVKHFLTGGSTSLPTGTTGTESSLSNWAGPYVTNMLGQGQALANMPYQSYMGQLTAGQSPLQTQAFGAASGLTTPTSIGEAATTAGGIGTAAQGLKYTPTTTSFDTTQMQNYMNPFLKGALEPQLEEARRQSQITQQQNAAKMTQAGAFGGGRQAILDAETQRALGANLANITGQGYSTAYDKAMQQFNADQARKAQEAQFGATYGLQGLQTGLQAAQAQGALGTQESQAGLANLNAMLNAGAQQRGIEAEGIAADKAQFEEARANPYKMVQFQQSLLSGLPLAAQSYNFAQPSTYANLMSGATTAADLLDILTGKTPAKRI